MLQTGLWWLDSLRQSEVSDTYVRNPRELERYLECLTRLTLSEVIIQASLARKASSNILDFHRVDYPETEPKEWRKFLTVKIQDDKVVTGDLPLNYFLSAPYRSTFKENYAVHAGL
jgi:succinate dehydrogenase/fumarate reductase flavoprotein subunit